MHQLVIGIVIRFNYEFSQVQEEAATSLHDSPPMEPPPTDRQQSPPPPPMEIPGGPSDEIRTLWIGDLENWMDESYLRSCLDSAGEIDDVRVIRNEQTRVSLGYAYAEFATRAAAEGTLREFNGKPKPHSEQPFRMYWADEEESSKNDNQIFVGNLAPDVTFSTLQETFKISYPSVKGARVVINRTTGKSKLYGFVWFGDPNERDRAVTEKNGVLLSERPMRIDLGKSKNSGGNPGSGQNNTTLFVSGLETSVTEAILRRAFSEFGELTDVKIFAEKRFGFVQFATRASAEKALTEVNGLPVEGKPIRLSWGRRRQNKQSSSNDSSSSGSRNYSPGGGGGNTSYGYAWPPYDPNIYPGYPIYPYFGPYPQ